MLCASLLAGCSSAAPAGHEGLVPTATDPTGSASSVPPGAPTAQPDGTVAAGEPTPGWDEQPDSSVVPDAALTTDQVDALLRVGATGVDAPGVCAGDGVDYTVTQVDAAAGHRYGALTVTNRSPTTCTVSGSPGLGGRGTWGQTFQWSVEQSTDGGAATVTLSPGAAATAALEWTGELAGAGAEQLSVLAVQLARGQHAVRVVPGTTDLGMLTTVRVGTWQAAG